MAVTNNPSERNPHGSGASASTMDRLLQPDITRLAALASLTLVLLNVVGLIILATSAMTNNSLSDGAVFGVLLPLLAMALAVVAASVSLLRGGVWAQRVLLMVWSVLAAGALAFLLSAMLMRVPDWMTNLMPEWAWITTAAIELVLSVGATALLVESAAPGTRLRYGTMVSVSVVVAVLLVIVANVVAQTDPIQWDIQALGRYGVSDWTKKILKGVDKPMRITCVYTSTDKDRRATDYRPRTLDYLEQLEYNAAKAGKKLEVVNITTDNGKAETIQRFQERMRKESSEQVKFLKGFDATAAELVKLLEDEKKDWADLGPEAFLSQWQLPVSLEEMFADQTDKLQKLGKKVRKKMRAETVIDYDALVDEVKQQLQAVQGDLKELAPALKGFDEIQKSVAKNRDKTLKALDAYADAVAAAAKTLPKDVKVDKAKEVLKKFAESAAAAQGKARAATDALLNVGGESNTRLIEGSRGYLMRRGGLVGSLPGFMNRQVQQVGQIAASARGMAQVLNPETMQQQISVLQQHIEVLQNDIGELRKSAESALKTLSSMDAKSKALLDRAEKNETFAKPLEKLDGLLAEIDKLPKGEPKTGGQEIEGDNLIIVEVGDEFRVASFEEVWPSQNRPGPVSDPDEPTRRLFNGDSAIGSKILSMTSEPFATVYLTYLRPFDQQTMMQMMRMGMQMGMRGMPDARYSPSSLNALRRRLEQANFDVRVWDLNEELEAPEDKDRPRVLLVLPPSPADVPEMFRMMMRNMREATFGPEHVAKIRAMVDSGIPAIFLTGWMQWKQPMSRGPNFGQVDDYLEKDWGIRVQGTRRVIAGLPDPQTPGRYKIDVHAFGYLPLSSFTDHPIGKPLQGQRMLWTDLAPLLGQKDANGTLDLPVGVTHETLLRVPEDRKNVWATANLMRVIRSVEEEEGGLIQPQPDDTRAPFDVALVAQREAHKPARSGATSFTVEDVTDWAGLVDALTPDKDETTPADPTAERRIFNRLPPAVQTALQFVKSDPKMTLTDAQKALLIEGLNTMLSQPDLYVPKAKAPPSMPGQPPQPAPKGPWDNVALGWEALALQAKTKAADGAPPKPLSKDEQRRFNRLAVEAALKDFVVSSQASKDVTIVVLSGGTSFFDFYMDRPVPRLNAKGGYSVDPAPRANADVILSAAYLLSGNKKYIAAGPTIIKPINVYKGERMVLAGLFVGLLPLLVVGLGLGAMYLRRRS